MTLVSFRLQCRESIPDAGRKDSLTTRFMVVPPCAFPITVDWVAVRRTVMDDRDRSVNGSIEFGEVQP